MESPILRTRLRKTAIFLLRSLRRLSDADDSRERTPLIRDHLAIVAYKRSQIQCGLEMIKTEFHQGDRLREIIADNKFWLVQCSLREIPLYMYLPHYYTLLQRVRFFSCLARSKVTQHL